MPALTPDEQRARVAAARVARLATLRPDGTPRLVPITFVLLDGLVCSAVDDVKPKRSPRLARLADVEQYVALFVYLVQFACSASATSSRR